MIKVGDVCKEKVSDEKEVMDVITKIASSEVTDVHMITSDGETQCLSFVDEETMNDTLEANRVISNDEDKDWLTMASVVFTDGLRTIHSI